MCPWQGKPQSSEAGWNDVLGTLENFHPHHRIAELRGDLWRSFISRIFLFYYSWSFLISWSCRQPLSICQPANEMLLSWFEKKSLWWTKRDPQVLIFYPFTFFFFFPRCNWTAVIGTYCSSLQITCYRRSSVSFCSLNCVFPLLTSMPCNRNLFTAPQRTWNRNISEIIVYAMFITTLEFKSSWNKPALRWFAMLTHNIWITSMEPFFSMALWSPCGQAQMLPNSFVPQCSP